MHLALLPFPTNTYSQHYTMQSREKDNTTVSNLMANLLSAVIQMRPDETTGGYAEWTVPLLP